MCNKFDSSDENQVTFDEQKMEAEDEPSSYEHEIIQDEDSHEMESNIVYEAYEIQEQLPTSSAAAQPQAKSQITLVRSTHNTSNQSQQLPLSINAITSPAKSQTLQLNSSQISQIQQQTQQIQAQQPLPLQSTIALNDEADLNFFLALLPDIKIMNQEQKRKLRIGTLKLIDDILSNTN